MRGAGGFGRAGSIALWAACLVPTAHAALANESQTVRQVVDTFAQAALRQGVAVGVAVAVIDRTDAGSSHTYTFGHADAAGKVPFARNSIFEIGSNTKVFTTNLLGQKVFEEALELGDPLSRFRARIGTLEPLTGRVTLKEIGDFTAGFPDLAPLCKDEPRQRGCLPSSRPTIAEYSAHRFVEFFRHTVPKDYNKSPPTRVTKLPAPYLYSDFSTGLLGLLLGTPPGHPITDASVDGWLERVDRRILKPLRMTDTWLEVPPTVPARRIAQGYSPAFATAEVSAGRVSKIDLLDGGGAYSSAPAVAIQGGGGSGATAVATIKDHAVAAIEIKTRGSGYTAPAELVLNGGGSTKTAVAMPLVADGAVAAVEVVSGGAGYQKTPTVTISGGRAASGRDAKAVAHIGNGRVRSIIVTDGGAGYVAPLTVTVAPGDPESSVIPVWAPAGALHSTIEDMAKLAAAALATRPGAPHLPISLTEGFRIAQRPSACAAEDPALETCPDDSNRVGLAWAIQPADRANKAPEIVTKNGGLPGFSSQIFLVPARRLAVVVLVNSETHGVDSENLGN